MNRIREAFFDAFTESNADGYILTFVWAFGVPGEAEYMGHISAKFRAKGAEMYWIELEAPLEERLKRNATENRLAHKPSKRDLASSEAHVRKLSNEYRFNSVEGEISEANYLRIDNTDLSAKQVASQIWDFVQATAGPTP